jgi:uncharacterized protein YcfL
MKKYFVALSLIAMTSLVMAGCLEKTEEAETPAEEVVVEEEVVTPEVTEETTEEEVPAEEAETVVE